jgi:hypothetical protein
LDTLNDNNLSGAEEVLGSKTIQKPKEIRANLIEQLSKLVTTDGRRVNIQNGLARINAQIETETKLVQIALTCDVAVAKGKVQALTGAVAQASNVAQLFTGRQRAQNDARRVGLHAGAEHCRCHACRGDAPWRRAGAAGLAAIIMRLSYGAGVFHMIFNRIRGRLTSLVQRREVA